MSKTVIMCKLYKCTIPAIPPGKNQHNKGVNTPLNNTHCSRTAYCVAVVCDIQPQYVNLY